MKVAPLLLALFCAFLTLPADAETSSEQPPPSSLSTPAPAAEAPLAAPPRDTAAREFSLGILASTLGLGLISPDMIAVLNGSSVSSEAGLVIQQSLEAAHNGINALNTPRHFDDQLEISSESMAALNRFYGQIKIDSQTFATVLRETELLLFRIKEGDLRVTKLSVLAERLGLDVDVLKNILTIHLAAAVYAFDFNRSRLVEPGLVIVQTLQRFGPEVTENFLSIMKSTAGREQFESLFHLLAQKFPAAEKSSIEEHEDRRMGASAPVATDFEFANARILPVIAQPTFFRRADRSQDARFLKNWLSELVEIIGDHDILAVDATKVRNDLEILAHDAFTSGILQAKFRELVGRRDLNPEELYLLLSSALCGQIAVSAENPEVSKNFVQVSKVFYERYLVLQRSITEFEVIRLVTTLKDDDARREREFNSYVDMRQKTLQSSVAAIHRNEFSLNKDYEAAALSYSSALRTQLQNLTKNIRATDIGRSQYYPVTHMTSYDNSEGLIPLHGLAFLTTFFSIEFLLAHVADRYFYYDETAVILTGSAFNFVGNILGWNHFFRGLKSRWFGNVFAYRPFHNALKAFESARIYRTELPTHPVHLEVPERLREANHSGDQPLALVSCERDLLLRILD